MSPGCGGGLQDMPKFHAALFPTTDFDRALAFYTSALGWSARADFDMGDGERWLEVEPPVGDAGIAFVRAASDARSGAIVLVADLEATHADFLARGLDVDAEIARPGSSVAVGFGAVTVTGPSPEMFYVRDPDGNELLHVPAG